MTREDIIINRFVGVFGYYPTFDRPHVRVDLGMMPATKLRLIGEVNLQLATPLEEIEVNRCKNYPNLGDHQMPKSTNILVCTETIHERGYEMMTAEEFLEDNIYDTPLAHSTMWAYYTLKFINVRTSSHPLHEAFEYDALEIVDIDYSITEAEVNESIDSDISLHNEHLT